MHMNELISVSQAENGYVVSVQVPMKKESLGNKPCGCVDDYERDKVFLVKTPEEVGSKIAEVLPMLYPIDPEQELQQAFSEATK